MKHPTSSRRFFLCLLPWISVFFSGGQFLAAQTPPACQQTKLLMPGGNPDDLAGMSVDLDTSFLFVGASQTNDDLAQDTTPGRVHIFRPGLTPNTWNQVQVLQGPDDMLVDHFGGFLEVNNDRLIVLARYDTGATFQSGAAYIFRYDPASEAWVLEDKVFASDGGFGDGSGDRSGDLAIIGSDGHDHGLIDSGAAHIFRFDGTSWNEEAELLAGDRASSDGFGRSVALEHSLFLCSGKCR